MNSLFCFSFTDTVCDIDIIVFPNLEIIYKRTCKDQNEEDISCTCYRRLAKSLYDQLYRIPFGNIQIPSHLFDQMSFLFEYVREFSILFFDDYDDCSLTKNYGSAFLENRSFYYRNPLVFDYKLACVNNHALTLYKFSRPAKLRRVITIQKWFRKRRERLRNSSAITLQRWWLDFYYANPATIKRIGESFNKKLYQTHVSPS